MADLYASYAELAANEQIGVEYDIRPVWIPGTSWASIAIHGGGIEPGTSEVAEAVAGTTMRFYEFDAHVTSGSNTDLHVTSANFDEPQAMAMVTNSDRCLSFHGFTGTDGVAETLIGGNDIPLRDRVQRALQAAGFTVTVASSEYPGTDPLNICNRSRLGGGVQLEMSRTLRESLFTNFTRAGRKNPANRTAAFTAYVAAVQSATVQRGGLVAIDSVNVSRWALLPGADDVDQVATFATDRLAAGGSEYIALVGRYADPSNCYLARVDLTTAQQVVLTLRRRQAGADTVLGTYTSPLTHAVGGFLSVRFQLAKTVLRASVWAGSSPPADWQLTAVDSAFTTGQMGIRFILSSTYTGALPVTATVRSYAATPLLSVLIASTAANGLWTSDPADMPFDVRVGGERGTVSAIGNPPRLNSNALFESTVLPWTTPDAGATVARSTAQAHEGVASLLLTPSGTGSLARAESEAVPVTAGRVYKGFMWVRCSVARTVEIYVAWFTSGGSFVDSGFATATIAATTWAPISVLATAPPTAGLAKFGLRLTGTPPATHTTWIDEAFLSDAYQQTVTLSARGVNGVLRAWPAGTEVDMWAPAIAPL